MAELNIMPWYTDAYLADTGDLSTEEHGAYDLLLMTMWRAGGSLPNDHDYLRRVIKTSERKWPKLWKRLQRFFTVDADGKVSQKRLNAEFKRASSKKEIAKANGSMGGRPNVASKSLKTQDAHKPNGYVSDNQSETKPEADGKRTESKTKPGGKLSLLPTPITDQRTNDSKDEVPWFNRTSELVEKLVSAANGNVVHGSEGIENVRPILDLIAMDCDLEADILPAIAELVPKMPDPLRTWGARFFRDAVLGRKAKRLIGRGAKRTGPRSVESQDAMAKDYAVRRYEVWPFDSPRPGREGCEISPEILIKHGIDPTTGERLKP